MGISFAGLSGGGGKAEVVKRITSTQTWTAPDDVDTVEVEIVGGGGSGLPASASFNASFTGGGGGGAGGYVRKVVNVTPGSTYTVTIGAGGLKNFINSSSNNDWYGAPGTSSSFGNLVEAYGGYPAVGNSVSNLAPRNLPGFADSGGSTGGGAVVDNGRQGPGGGGAGSPARGEGVSGNSNYSFALDKVANREGRFVATQGFAGGTASNSNDFISPMGGMPINGLAAGGSGGNPYANSDREYHMSKSSHGIGGAGFHDNTNAGSGSINTGSGGGGGGRVNGNPRNAGAGGSGVCILRYVTAGE